MAALFSVMVILGGLAGTEIAQAILVVVVLSALATVMFLFFNSLGEHRQRLVLGENGMLVYPGPLIPSRRSIWWYRILVWSGRRGWHPGRGASADPAEVQIKRESLIEITIEEDEVNNEDGWITLRHRQGELELTYGMMGADRRWLYDLLAAWMAG